MPKRKTKKLKARTYQVTATQSQMFSRTVLLEVPVLSDSPANALNLVREEILDRIASDEFPMEPTEIKTHGPRGGEYTRFLGQ